MLLFIENQIILGHHTEPYTHIYSYQYILVCTVTLQRWRQFTYTE